MLLNPYRFGSVPWTPAMLSGLRAWYVSDNPGNTLVSGDLDTLQDKSGNGIHMPCYLADAANRGLLVPSGLGGRTVWRSDPSAKKGAFYTDTSTAGSIAQNSSGVTLFAIHRMNPAQTVLADGSVIRFRVGLGSGARAMIGRGDAALNAIYAGGRRLDSDGWDGAADNSNFSNSWAVIVAVIDYANARLDLSINGTVTTDSPFQTAGMSSNTQSLNFVIGHSGAGASGAYGDYAELGAIRGALTLSDREKLEGYLSWQWGLEGDLPGGHPYKLSPP